MLSVFIDKLLRGCDLTADESERMLEVITDCSTSRIQAAAALTALRMKKESAPELVGGVRMLRKHAQFIDCGARGTIDIVGTGGDGGISFNISTASAFVAAGAGCAVAKHGNRAVSGKCGSADVLEELGVRIDAAACVMENCIQSHMIGFLYARTMHPVMGAVAAMRRELGFRTIFNMLGPLTNPAGAKRLVIGVYDNALTELFAEVLRELGAEHALVVHGRDGLDEISVSEPTRVAELKHGVIRSYELYPELLIGQSYERGEISGGDAHCNAMILKGILAGDIHGAPRAIVTLNAGAAILVAGLAESIKDGIAAAEKAIDSGAALEKLEILVRESRS